MGINSPAASGAAKEIYDYTQNLVKGSITSSATANTFQTLVSVTGKGILKKATILGSSNTQFAKDIKITIDGVVIFWTNGRSPSGNACVMGLIDEGSVVYNGSAASPYYGGNVAGSLAEVYYQGAFPSTARQTQAIVNGSTAGTNVPLINPIRFNSSLLIETSCAGASQTITYDIQYLL
jgi:hypothetical protein